MPGLSVSVCMTVNSNELDGPAGGEPYVHSEPHRCLCHEYGLWLTRSEVLALYATLNQSVLAGRNGKSLRLKVRDLYSRVKQGRPA